MKYCYEIHYPRQTTQPPFLKIVVEFGDTEMGIDDVGDFSAIDTDGNTWFLPKGEYGMIRLVPIREDDAEPVTGLTEPIMRLFSNQVGP